MSDIDDVLLDAEDKMDKAIGVAREDFGTIRTGRANAAMFNKVMVDYYGTYTPVNQIDRKSTRLNSSHIPLSRMPSSA